MAVFASEHMMHEQDACNQMVTSCNAMKDQKSPHRACHRHMSMVGLFLLLACQNRHHLLSFHPGSSLGHSGPYLVWLHQPSRGRTTKCWWTTDTDVSGEAMGMQQTGRTSTLQCRLESSTFIVVGDYYWTTVERKEPLPAFQIRQ